MDCDFSPSSPHLLPNGLFSPQNRISFELLALSGLSGFSTFKGGKMLIFQGFASSRIVREFPPFSFKVRIATLTRNRGADSTSGVRMGALTPWFTTLPKSSILRTIPVAFIYFLLCLKISALILFADKGRICLRKKLVRRNLGRKAKAFASVQKTGGFRFCRDALYHAETVRLNSRSKPFHSRRCCGYKLSPLARHL